MPASRFPLFPVLLLPLLLSACATRPAIHDERFTRPRTVAIVEAPAMRNAAVIGLAPLDVDFHFTPKSDYFFVIDPGKDPAGEPLDTGSQGMIAAGAVAAGTLARNTSSSNKAGQIGVGLAMGLLIDASAAATQRKAESFHQELLQHYPNLDLRSEFSSALQTGLKAKGIQTIVIRDSMNTEPRLRWPVGDADPETAAKNRSIPISRAGLPTVDADLLVQYSPVAYYMAPGPLNNYRVHASVGIAVYDARTRVFLGRETFAFNPKAWDNEYTTYSGLHDNMDKYAAAVRAGLLSLVPEVVDVISKERKAK